ncbi:hypothetical protein [Nocardiopsis lucentensis]|uniref:hypothetical protein n=1 Tax=Nocardiopsis lucentensis TaxID=53441 RepID=UPI0003490C19|nr:hypothetical protein [Nocardiopsis lucentensis]
MADTARSGRGRYRTSTSSPVRYRPITLGGRVIAYLWAATEEDAASCVMVLAAAEPIVRLGVASQWSKRLQEAGDQGMTATQALEHWSGSPEDPVAGSLGGPAREAANLDELYELANPGHESAPPPVRDRPEEPGRGRAPDWGPLSPFTLDVRSYHPTTESAVRYLPVRDDEQVVGYLWAAETDDAASFIATTASGRAGSVAKSHWIRWMVERRNEELSPLEALRRAAREPETPYGGRVPPDTPEATAPSLRALEEIAWA